MPKRGKPISQRISDSFTDNGAITAAQAYADKVYTSWGDVTGSLRRSVVLIFLLAAAFEILVYQRPSSAITFGSFTFADAPLVQMVLPTVIAFLAYDGSRLTGRWVDLQITYSNLTRKLSPRLYQNDLHVLVEPPLPAFWPVGTVISENIRQRSEEFVERTATIVGVTTVIIFPIAFEGQAYYRLVQKFGYQNIFLWVNLGITLILLACTVIYLYLYTHEES